MFLVFRCTVGDCSLKNGTPAIMTLVSAEFGWLYAVIYVLTIMLVTFGIFNLIMATFVDNALKAAQTNERIRLRERLADSDRQVTVTSQLVHKLWKRAQPAIKKSEAFNFNSAVECSITKDVFDDALLDPEVRQLLGDLDISEEDRIGLFDVLDADNGGTLQLYEIIHGVLKLRGEPRRSDVVQVSLMVRSLQEGMIQLLEQQAKVVVPTKASR